MSRKMEDDRRQDDLISFSLLSSVVPETVKYTFDNFQVLYSEVNS